MSAEFQIIFTSITTLLAGLALFVLRGVFAKFEDVEDNVKDIQDKAAKFSERLTRIETRIEMCPGCQIEGIRRSKEHSYDE